jgi:hypothetical protein
MSAGAATTGREPSVVVILAHRNCISLILFVHTERLR